MTDQDWPVAAFDPVRRLRVIAAATPGASIREVVVGAPVEEVWAVAADLERELPHWLSPTSGPSGSPGTPPAVTAWWPGRSATPGYGPASTSFLDRAGA
ncbi:MAG: hypothetical protein ACR2JG_06410 [Geodermatophilaceae bacterium]